MFTGELDDNRTSKQRRLDHEREWAIPRQMGMFPQRDLAQFGVRAHPQMSLAPDTKLVLVREDPRTPEEIEQDLQRQAEEQTNPMFDEKPTD